MAPVSRWFKLTCWVMAALFALCVALQHNDPDPLRWMLIYGAALVVSVLLPMYRAAAKVGAILGAAALVWTVMLLIPIWDKVSPSDAFLKMSEKGGAVEDLREAGGLAIEGLWLALASWYRLRRA
ncbi:MAG: transmembrane 220 family protein [Deltaproteobacteria bacterium]|nr:transmembrane 220 family protein [Deltaproteobacteria bacterium]